MPTRRNSVVTVSKEITPLFSATLTTIYAPGANRILPAINALAIVLVVPGLYSVGLGILLAGALGLFIVFVLYFKKQPNDQPVMLITAGVCCQMAGHIMLISKQFYPMAFP